jgi:5'-deoxynucleotidase YfbR-like HD superfamily hydrolase
MSLPQPQPESKQTVQIAVRDGDANVRYQEFKKYIELAEEKTVITLLEKLVDERILEFITEYPSTKYTKEMTKLNTYLVSYAYEYNLNLEDDNDLEDIKEMCHQFMLKMTSHKRRRSHELVNGASRQMVDTAVINENRGIKRFLGMR